MNLKEVVEKIENKRAVIMVLNTIKNKSPLTKSQLTASIGSNLTGKERREALSFLVNGNYVSMVKPFQPKRGPSTSTIKLLANGRALLKELLK